MQNLIPEMCKRLEALSNKKEVHEQRYIHE